MKKTKLKTETVKIQYWSCSKPYHRHKTAEVATACIEKYEKGADYRKANPIWTKEKYADLLKKHREGARQCDLARELNLSPTWVMSLLWRAGRIERNVQSGDPFLSLSRRVANCLKCADLKSIEEIRAADESGSLLSIPNMGKESVREVQAWLAGQESH